MNTPITDRAIANPEGRHYATNLAETARALEQIAVELAEALQWYHGGEPLPTLATAALANWQAMKEATK